MCWPMPPSRWAACPRSASSVPARCWIPRASSICLATSWAWTPVPYMHTSSASTATARLSSGPAPTSPAFPSMISARCAATSTWRNPRSRSPMTSRTAPMSSSRRKRRPTTASPWASAASARPLSAMRSPCCRSPRSSTAPTASATSLCPFPPSSVSTASNPWCRSRWATRSAMNWRIPPTSSRRWRKACSKSCRV